MKFYKSLGKNDCLRGCLATILQIPARKLPDPKLPPNTYNWIKIFNKEYKKFNIQIYITDNKKGWKIGYVSNGRRSEYAHVLICKEGKIIWCPAHGKNFNYRDRDVLFYLGVRKCKV